jgi:hypothetical protein
MNLTEEGEDSLRYAFSVSFLKPALERSKQQCARERIANYFLLTPSKEELDAAASWIALELSHGFEDISEEDKVKFINNCKNFFLNEISEHKKFFSQGGRSHYFAAGCTIALTLSADLYLLSQAFTFGYIAAAAIITTAGALAASYFWSKGGDLAEKEMAKMLSTVDSFL